MTTVYLARHGESDWNAESRFQGHSDRPLTSLGRQQAETLADELAATAALDAIYSSPLRRAFDTAVAVGDRLGLEPVAVTDLSEVDVGGWTGLSRAEVQERFPDAFARWLDGGEGWTDGESYADDVRAASSPRSCGSPPRTPAALSSSSRTAARSAPSRLPRRAWTCTSSGGSSGSSPMQACPA